MVQSRDVVAHEGEAWVSYDIPWLDHFLVAIEGGHAKTIRTSVKTYPGVSQNTPCAFF